MAITYLTSLLKPLICTASLVLMTYLPKGLLASDALLFSCSFTSDTCGMENRPAARAYWQKEYLTIGKRHGPAMVVRGNAAKNNFARLLSPEILVQGARTGCLRFQYFIEGRTPASIAVIKQGFVTKYVFATARKTEDGWKKAEVDVQFMGDKVMFYFEADTRLQDYGTSLVAFTDLTIAKNSCRHRRQFG